MKEPARTRKQFGAVPFRVTPSGDVEVMLITSRERSRWIIPKGWPKKAGPRPTARAEAFEEAGLRGKLHRKALGSYMYDKVLSGGTTVRCKLRVYPLDTRKQEKDWPEKAERSTKWFALDDAAKLSSEPGLGLLIRKLSKRMGKKRRRG
jgi:8-oxo-dGTP pyrophosphatase MutT (NUDIX family)